MRTKAAGETTVERAEIGTRTRARCRKCRGVTMQVVVGKIDWKPTRVECSVCGTVNEFRVPRVERKVGGSGASVAGLKPEELWRASMRRSKGARSPYDRTRCYQVGSSMDHTRFGPGVVIRLASTTVCEVAFETGTIKLLMATSGPRSSG